MEVQQSKHPKLLQDAAAAAAAETAADDPPPVDPESIARSYQLEALELAIERNTIAFLETGSGKTLIAVMLLRAFAGAVRKPSDSIAVFLVPTVVLVAQQARVIETHTDLKVGQFYGEMGVDFWSADTWKRQLQLYEVFVMTPQILLNNLWHRFFKLEKIKLLIFDECHHARGKHPYALIMTEFYHRQLKSNPAHLPRIFGMTASLIYSKGSNNRSVYYKQIMGIESLMNAKAYSRYHGIVNDNIPDVYTVVSESILAQYIPFSTAKIKLYKHVDMPSKLFSLCDQLESLKLMHLKELPELMLDSSVEDSARKKIKKLHGTFLFCLTELGVWLAAKAAEYLSHKENDSFFWGERKHSEKIVRQFSLDVFKIFSKYLPAERCIGEDLHADTVSGLLSSKVHCLIMSLLDYRMVDNLRCIVFVERVITAIVLQSLFQGIQELSWLGTKYMAGNQSGLQSQTRKEQMRIVDTFQDGTAKIIVATQILEEGLDVQSCNLVVRFDQAMNVCSFIQSRGRARMRGSEYLLIIRSGDSSTLSKVTSYLSSGYTMREESLRQASLPCKPLESEIYDEEFYCVETTGAKVTLSSSVSLLCFYCSRLPSDGYFKPVPRFVMKKESNICMLHLPKSCPVKTLVVEGEAGKLKQIACLEALKKLHQIGALSDFLLPAFDVDMEDDTQESDSETYNTEQSDYFPGELVDSWSSFCSLGLYHCYTIRLNQHFNYETSFNDILLVVKSDLGGDPLSYSFNLEADRGSITVDVKYCGPVHFSREQVLMAMKFQVSALNVLIHHDFVKFQDTMKRLHKTPSCMDVAYLLLPLVGGKVDWHCIKSSAFSISMAQGRYQEHCFCTSGAVKPIQSIDGAVCRCMLQNSVVYTPHNGRFYCIKGILNHRNGDSSLVLNDGEVLTYKKYYKTRHGIDLKWSCESLLRGRHLFTVRNFLTGRPILKKEEFSSAGVELPPELCKIILSPVSIGTLYSFSFLPSIMHRIEALVLAVKLKWVIQLDHQCVQKDYVQVTKILEAITTKKCQEEFSLESLETLGDSFLKYAASQHLFKSYEHHHQGILTAMRERLISNASLCQFGCRRNLTGFIRTEKFDSKKWSIPGDCLSFHEQNQTSCSSQTNIYNRGIKNIKSKVVADSVEALIGAYLSSGGELAAFRFLKWLGLAIDFRKEMVVEKPILSRLERFINLKELQILLKYTFNDPSLLVEALTHGSYQVQDIPKCYQRLEFLGDAVLDLLITVHLCNKYPGATPGLITDLRSASVNNDCYAHAAAKAGLNKHILHASSELHNQMSYYLNNFSQSFSGSSYGWEAGVALPKVLADVIESISGAIYIDSKFDKGIVWESIRPLLEPIVTPETMKQNPVRELSELCSKKAYNLSFSKAFEHGQASLTATVEANGVVYEATSKGTDKKTAKKLAARELLETLKTAIPGL